LLLAPPPALVADSRLPPELAIRRAAGRIAIDGELSDDGWKSAHRVETWYETNPGDNTPPPVGNVGYLAYDDKALYAAFEFQDPDPRAIRAPLGDRDNVPSTTDYGGGDPRHPQRRKDGHPLPGQPARDPGG
jgi:hypothetical protein